MGKSSLGIARAWHYWDHTMEKPLTSFYRISVANPACFASSDCFEPKSLALQGKWQSKCGEMGVRCWGRLSSWHMDQQRVQVAQHYRKCKHDVRSEWDRFHRLSQLNNRSIPVSGFRRCWMLYFVKKRGQSN